MHAVRATRATESELFTPTIVEVRSSAADGDASTSSFAAVDEIRFGVSAKRRKKDVDHRWMCAVALQSMHDGMPAMLSASHSLYASDDVSRSVVRCSATPLQHAEQAFRIVLLRHADGSAAEPTTRDAACFVDLVARSSSRPGGGEASARRAGVAMSTLDAAAATERSAVAPPSEPRSIYGLCRILVWEEPDESFEACHDARDTRHVSASALIGELSIDDSGWLVSCLLFTVTFHANHAHNLTFSP